MEYRFLGSSGLKVSALSFGAWVTFGLQIDEAGAAECMKVAFDNGVNFFDNAEAYADGQAEVIMGNVLKRVGWKRSDVVVSTKIFWGGHGPNDRGLSRKHVIEGVNASLSRLQMDYVDLVFCHRPDLHTPIEETVWAMNHVVNSGKAFYWGTSEWSADQIVEAVAVARRDHLIPPQMEQPQYHMFHRVRVEREYARLCDEIGLGLTTWSPLASGLLSGKYRGGVPKGSRFALEGYEWLQERGHEQAGSDGHRKIEALAGVADDLGVSMPQMAIAWCLRNGNVSTVITGASKAAQVEENMKAIDVVARLDDEVMDRIESILGNRPAPRDDFR